MQICKGSVFQTAQNMGHTEADKTLQLVIESFDLFRIEKEIRFFISNFFSSVGLKKLHTQGKTTLLPIAALPPLEKVGVDFLH